jgi:hypothetical protein
MVTHIKRGADCPFYFGSIEDVNVNVYEASIIIYCSSNKFFNFLLVQEMNPACLNANSTRGANTTVQPRSTLAWCAGTLQK